MLPAITNKIDTKVNQCLIGAVFCITMTVLLNVYISMTSGFTADILWSYADPLILAILAFGVVKKRSRVCALLLFSFYVFSKAYQFMEYPTQINAGSMIMTVYITYAFFQGISGTFAHHKLLKTEKKVAT